MISLLLLIWLRFVIQIRLINQSEPFYCFILPPAKLIKAKEGEMINKQIWFPGPLSLDNMVGETRSGLSSVFNIQCSKCGEINNVRTSNHHRTGSRGPKASGIDSRAVLGFLHIGVGQTQLKNFLATLNTPTMNSQLFKIREREIANSIKKVAKASCDVYLEQEKENAEKSNNQGEADSMPGIAVSHDMDWMKRG